MDDTDLLNAFKSMFMRCPESLRQQLIDELRAPSEREVLQDWADEACGDYSFQVFDIN